MSETPRPYSVEDARDLRRGIGYALLLALPGWLIALGIVFEAGLTAWPLALVANLGMTALLLGAAVARAAR